MQLRTGLLACVLILCMSRALFAADRAEQIYREGFESLVAGDARQARSKFESAAKAEPRSPVYRAALKTLEQWEQVRSGEAEARNRFWQRTYEDALRALDRGDFATAAGLNAWVKANYHPAVLSVQRLNAFEAAERTLGASNALGAEAAQLIEEGECFTALSKLDPQLSLNREDRLARSLYVEAETRCAPIVQPLEKANNLWLDKDLDAALSHFEEALKLAQNEKAFASFEPQIQDWIRQVRNQKRQSQDLAESARLNADHPIAAAFAIRGALDLWAKNPEALKAWGQAEKHYRGYEAARDEGQRLMREQDYPQAIAAFEKLAAENPVDADLKRDLDRVRIMQKDRQQQMAMAKALAESDDLVGALQLYQQINAEKEVKETATKIARSYQDGRKYRQAIAFYELAGLDTEAKRLRKLFDINEPVKPIMLSARSTSELVRQVRSSVVLIRAGQSLGSGFIVREDGMAITNTHVVGDSTTVKVRLYGSDPGDPTQEIEAKVVEKRADLDLALLQLQISSPLKPVQLGRAAELQTGDTVVAIGAPEGLEQSVTQGIVSQFREMGGRKLIQTDAAMNPGNSGGPLFNAQGEVVGINTFKMMPTQDASSGIPIQGLNFAIQIEHVIEAFPRAIP
ncbi:MAG: trypsin-like peptidase domain-containing protein [Verrucomicrobiae bacterium]|nr:trypsin-like peptidase domain-containing protein [Verrucomicrobiae bacterium]